MDKGKKSRDFILAPAFRIDLFNNPTKYHLNISNDCRIMLRKLNIDARPTNRPAAEVHHFNNQSFLLENQVKNSNVLDDSDINASRASIR